MPSTSVRATASALCATLFACSTRESRVKVVRVKVPASIGNLGPGFDCVGLAVDMYNVIEMEWSDSGTTIDVMGEGSDGSIPASEDNVVYQAASQLFQKASLPPPQVAVRLYNSIPPTRGLGSSAAAIVGGLVATNEILADRFRRRFSEAELFGLAVSLEGHLDNVAAALAGGMTISWVDAETPRFFRVPTHPLRIVLVIPRMKLKTSDSRAVLPRELPRSDAVFNIARTALLVAGMVTGNLEVLRYATEDRLHQPYRAPLVPGFTEVTREALEAGAYGTGLSGSGPSIFAVCREDRATDVSEAMAGSMRKTGVDFAVWCGGIALRGAHVEV